MIKTAILLYQTGDWNQLLRAEEKQPAVGYCKLRSAIRRRARRGLELDRLQLIDVDA